MHLWLKCLNFALHNPPTACHGNASRMIGAQLIET